MDIDLINDLRRDDVDDDDDESDAKHKRDDDNDDEESKNTDIASVMKKANEAAKKKVARRPRPKLDVDRLIGPKGLDELCNLLKAKKFKGKGYEVSDLDTLMHQFEYWAHRLVPHMAFDDFIEKGENLGGKKPIKNALQNLRDQLNIPTGQNDGEQASHTLLDLLPTFDDEPEVNSLDKSPDNAIPNDDELNELFQ